MNVFITGAYAAPTRYSPLPKSYAVFGELTCLFFDKKLELTAGLRYFEDDVALKEASRFNRAPASQWKRAGDTFTATTPPLALTWHARKETTLYASYGEGFRSGVFQAPSVLQVAPFPPAEPII